MPVRLKTDLGYSSPVRCHTRPALPSRSRVTVCACSQGPAASVLSRIRQARPLSEFITRQPFRCRQEYFGGHPKRRTSLDCLAEMLAGTSVPSPTWATLPVHGVSSTWLTCQAPATTPAAMDLPALIKDFVERVASLSDVTPRTPALWVRLSRRPSFRSPRYSRRRTISGARTQKPPLTRKRWVFAIWHRLSFHLPASPCGPFMVELFTAGDLRPTPSQSRPGSACHQVGSSPRRPRLNDPLKRMRTPGTGLRRTVTHNAPSPALNLDGLD